MLYKEGVSIKGLIVTRWVGALIALLGLVLAIAFVAAARGVQPSDILFGRTLGFSEESLTFELGFVHLLFDSQLQEIITRQEFVEFLTLKEPGEDCKQCSTCNECEKFQGFTSAQDCKQCFNCDPDTGECGTCISCENAESNAYSELNQCVECSLCQNINEDESTSESCKQCNTCLTSEITNIRRTSSSCNTCFFNNSGTYESCFECQPNPEQTRCFTCNECRECEKRMETQICSWVKSCIQGYFPGSTCEMDLAIDGTFTINEVKNAIENCAAETLYRELENGQQKICNYRDRTFELKNMQLVDRSLTYLQCGEPQRVIVTSSETPRRSDDPESAKPPDYGEERIYSSYGVMDWNLSYVIDKNVFNDHAIVFTLPEYSSKLKFENGVDFKGLDLEFADSLTLIVDYDKNPSNRINEEKINWAPWNRRQEETSNSVRAFFKNSVFNELDTIFYHGPENLVNSGKVHLKLTVGDVNFGTGPNENGECRYNLYVCAQETLTDDEFDPILNVVKLFREINMTKNPHTFLSTIPSADIDYPGANYIPSQPLILLLYNSRAIKFSETFEVDLGPQRYLTNQLVASVIAGVRDWFFINRGLQTEEGQATLLKICNAFGIREGDCYDQIQNIEIADMLPFSYGGNARATYQTDIIGDSNLETVPLYQPEVVDYTEGVPWFYRQAFANPTSDPWTISFGGRRAGENLYQISPISFQIIGQYDGGKRNFHTFYVNTINTNYKGACKDDGGKVYIEIAKVKDGPFEKFSERSFSKGATLNFDSSSDFFIKSKDGYHFLRFRSDGGCTLSTTSATMLFNYLQSVPHNKFIFYREPDLQSWNGKVKFNYAFFARKLGPTVMLYPFVLITK